MNLTLKSILYKTAYRIEKQHMEFVHWYKLHKIRVFNLMQQNLHKNPTTKLKSLMFSSAKITKRKQQVSSSIDWWNLIIHVDSSFMYTRL